MDDLSVVILAAGQGLRMKSRLPKVLHKVAGWPMLKHVLLAAATASPNEVVVVVGHGGEQIRVAFGSDPSTRLGQAPRYVDQPQQLGTGHAVMQAKPLLEGKHDHVLVLYGDTPLIQGSTITDLVRRHRAGHNVVTMLTGVVDDPTGYGRVVRNQDGRVSAIVEESVASDVQRAIKEINSGVYCFQGDWLWPRLSQLKLSEKGEYYLTDLIGLAIEEGRSVETLRLEDSQEILGINTREQLAVAEAALRWRVRRQLMRSGVTMIDPASTFVDASVRIAEDTVIYPYCFIEGDTEIGEGCVIGPSAYIIDSHIGRGCRIIASMIEQATLANEVRVGPFSRIRQNSELADGVFVGNFAEIKKSRLGRNTKMHHFSYLGDATVGERVNVGAGTITCNFDSETGQKSPTVLEDDVAVGSDTMLVAPVRIGAASTTGAGSVVTRDIPPNSVAFGVPAKVIRPSKKARSKTGQ